MATPASIAQQATERNQHAGAPAGRRDRQCPRPASTIPSMEGGGLNPSPATTSGSLSPASNKMADGPGAMSACTRSRRLPAAGGGRRWVPGSRRRPLAAAVGIGELLGAGDAFTAAERAAACTLLSEKLPQISARSDLLRGWCRRLPPVITQRAAALLPGQPVALPDPPQRKAPQRQDAMISPAPSHAARELRGHIARARRAGRPRCGANLAGAAVRYDQNAAAAAGSDEWDQTSVALPFAPWMTWTMLS